jgi:hypothetical protein
MNDSNKFVNSYIETCMNTLHENLANIVQLKTQLKVANDLIAEKDVVIGNMMRELETKAHVESQYHNAIETHRGMNNELVDLRNKVTHLDTALRQVAEMKTMIVIKDKEIESLKNKEQKVYVKKKKKEILKSIEVPETVNDF